MWLIDRLFNRKIEGESSLDSLEPIQENLKAISGKVGVVGNKVVVDGDFEADGVTSHGIANTGALANIGDVAVSGNISATGTVSANKVVEEGDTALVNLGGYVNTGFAKSHTLYAKLMVRHNVLYVVVSGKVVAGASASTNPSLINNFYELLPSGLAERIYRADGTTIDEALSDDTNFNNAFICGSLLTKRVGSTLGSANCIMRSTASGNLRLDIYGMGSVSEDAEILIDARFVLTL